MAGKLEKLATEYGETISSKVKLAILYGMMPREVQERLLDKCRVQWSTMKDEDVARTVVAVLEEVKELAKSRREQIIPVPMDISHMVQTPSDPQPTTKFTMQDECAGDEWAGYEEWCDWRENDVNVNLIGKGFGGGKGGKGKGKSRSCFTCGALGHMSWECPKGKGKGKDKGGGKGMLQQWGFAGWRKRQERERR